MFTLKNTLFCICLLGLFTTAVSCKKDPVDNTVNGTCSTFEDNLVGTNNKFWRLSYEVTNAGDTIYNTDDEYIIGFLRNSKLALEPNRYDEDMLADFYTIGSNCKSYSINGGDSKSIISLTDTKLFTDELYFLYHNYPTSCFEAINSNVTGTMTANINGTPSTLSNVFAFRRKKNGVDYVVIQGVGVDGSSTPKYPIVTLTTYGKSLKTYSTLESSGPQGLGLVRWSPVYNQNTSFIKDAINKPWGEIKLTEVNYVKNGKVKGTFSFKTQIVGYPQQASDSTILKSGVFEATFVN